MQYDELDNKFREAADNHHPVYDQTAWQKMQKLLDEHLPTDDNRRKLIFLLLILVVLGIGGFLIVQDRGSKNLLPAENTIQQAASLPSNTIEKNIPQVVSNESEEPVEKTEVPALLSEIKKPGDVGKFKSKLISGRTEQTAMVSPADEISVKEKFSAIKTETNQNNVEPKAKTDTKTNPLTNKQQGSSLIRTEASKTESFSTINPANKTNSENDAPKSKPVQLVRSGKNNKGFDLFFSLSAGPDISFIHFDKPGTTKVFVGGGLGYTHKNRLTLRTGFYSGRKVYDAAPQDYNAPANFYTYYPYLESVEADCHVYEIPVSLSYQFGKSQKQKFFTSAGVSSYMMKKEKYRYYYKTTPGGPTINRNWSPTKRKTHIAAGVTLSAGYTRNLNKHISMTVAPYTTLPVKGVGFGNVKLYSAGVLFSANIHPFRKPQK